MLTDVIRGMGGCSHGPHKSSRRRMWTACREMNDLGLSKYNDIGAFPPICTGPLFGLVGLNICSIFVHEHIHVRVWPPIHILLIKVYEWLVFWVRRTYCN